MSDVLSDAARDALGYVGGSILALSLVPQIIKLLMTRSAADISLMWSLLYLLGTTLSFVYLVMLGAIAAWIPVCVEVCGCLITITLKLMYDHTSWGRNQQLLLELELQQEDLEAQGQVLLQQQPQDQQEQQKQQPAGQQVVQQPQQQLLQDKPGEPKTPQQPILRNSASLLRTAIQKQQSLRFSEQQPPSGQQQQQGEPLLQQQQPQQRTVTKKRVVLNAPMTAAEAAETAAAVASGDVVLTIGIPTSPRGAATAISSAATSLACSPRGDGPVMYYESNRPLPKWHTASGRRMPWYMLSGISHHSVLPRVQPVQSVTPSSSNVPCCHACGAPQRHQPVAAAVSHQASGRAWTNLLFSPAATPRGTQQPPPPRFTGDSSPSDNGSSKAEC